MALLNAPHSPFELACAAEDFSTVRQDQPVHYLFRIRAERPGPLQTTARFAMLVDEGLAALEEADTVVVPGWQPPGGAVPPTVLEALRAAHRRGARIRRHLHGTLVLAQARLLDGRRATTHWRRTAQLAAECTKVWVARDVLFVDHGDVATSGGSGAGIGLCLHLVRSDHGAAHVAQIAPRDVSQRFIVSRA
nr:AraC family transcriptional regulator [Streptomyces sp. MJM1172]